MNCMLCFSLLSASSSYRYTSLDKTRAHLSRVPLPSATRRFNRIPKAFFGKKEGNSGQDQEDSLASWGEEQPDWIESPDQQHDSLEEVWYEVSTRLPISSCVSATLCSYIGVTMHLEQCNKQC